MNPKFPRNVKDGDKLYYTPWAMMPQHGTIFVCWARRMPSGQFVAFDCRDKEVKAHQFYKTVGGLKCAITRSLKKRHREDMARVAAMPVAKDNQYPDKWGREGARILV